ncbi:hypothetical protein BDY21DRAFT_284214 [Lineolata rhizophorae]|uniref:NAD(P)-binding protein n=1 Tax=Lineolata rhizophorae TaxID=578093 RepID=A0A6A6P2U8_9PEZI|nr:hypothetical protein BDY21DRAFT_284214 [Lineolata rhizophorae]
MKPPFPSPTPTWHNDVYPTIDPSNPSLSHAGQTVIVTGAGSGIGRETALAFAASGVKHLVLTGRTQSTIEETKALLPAKDGLKVSTYAVSVMDIEGMQKIASEVGQWDVLVLNAGYISTPAPIAKAPLEEYWGNFETNVKGIVIASQAFFPTANPERAAVMTVTAGAFFLPTKQVVGLSGYLVSKLAQVKMLEFLAAENPNMFFCNVHPGMIDTKIFRGSGATPDMLPMDTAQLPAHFMVWCSLPEGQFLNGRTVWANWDVDELKAMKDEVEQKNLFTNTFVGWPFPHMG